MSNAAVAEQYGYRISIPKWYDYERNYNTGFWMCFDISIPKWYDYEPQLKIKVMSNKGIFQFQNGTIMSFSTRQKRAVCSKFQFQNGTIMRI